MFSKLRKIAMILAAAALASCGGGGGTITSPGGGDDGGGGGTVEVATVQLVASSTTLTSDVTGISKVTITAVVKDSGNVVIADLPVTFSTSSGSLSVVQPVTNAVGAAVAELTNGLDPTNRTITVTASAGGVSGTVKVNVTGTTLTVTGPSALALADTATYTFLLRDGLGAGIPGRVIAVTSATGNTLSSANLNTNASGQAAVNVTATTAGNDALTGSALSLTATRAIAVSGDVFTLLEPTSGQELPLNTNVDVRVRWTKAGVPQAGKTITFSSTRGSLSASNAITDGAGEAVVTVSSTTAGSAIVSAVNDEATVTSSTVEFVASVADAIELQASIANVGVGQQSTITATVRDAQNNLVKNKVVFFTVDDNTGGFLSVGSDVTDSLGRATTVYTGGGSPSAPAGVTIRAFVEETVPVPATIERQLTLTVVGQAVDMSLGSGDTLNLPTQSLYSKEWAIIVTNTAGTAPVANTTLQASIRSTGYRKGRQVLVEGTGWVPFYDTDPDPNAETLVQGTYFCPDEDDDRDGFLDPGEDKDGDTKLEAGNRASVVALAPGASANACGSLAGLAGSTAEVQTDENGIARICVVYLRSDNLWVDVELKSLLNVFGSEFTETASFTLEPLASDIKDESSSPAGQFSPFGEVNDCTNPD